MLSDGFLDLDPDSQNLLGHAMEQVTERYRDGIGAHQAVELATAWAVTQDHPTDITVLTLHRAQA